MTRLVQPTPQGVRGPESDVSGLGNGYSDASVSTWPLGHSTRGGESLGNEAIQRAWSVEGNQARHRLAVVGDRHLVPFAHKLEVAAEVVTKVSNSSIHAIIVALSMVNI